MKLTELDPRWLEHSGKRIGLAFLCPVKRKRADGTESPTPHRMTCFFVPLDHSQQYDAVVAAIGVEAERWTQLCRDGYAWTCEPPIAEATFENITIAPSIDGGVNSWHGWIKNGEIA